MDIHHSRQASLAATQQVEDFGIDMNANLLPLPPDLSEDVQIDTEFLASVQNPDKFSIFIVSCDFFPYDERHMQVKKELLFVGLGIVEDSWVFGCPDINPSNFGFVPLSYLKYVKEIDRKAYLTQ